MVKVGSIWLVTKEFSSSREVKFSKGEKLTVVNCDEIWVGTSGDYSSTKHNCDGDCENGHGWFIYPHLLKRHCVEITNLYSFFKNPDFEIKA